MNDTVDILSGIQTPVDLKQLDDVQLAQLPSEMRAHLIERLNQCGGHFGANLGCVELAIALHYVFDTPNDRLIWDVGHQAYPHKMLTGRAAQLHTIKQPGGLAPFPKRNESVFDFFGAGHSSTSISAALGSAVGSALAKEERHTVAVIGDGGLTGGMAFEALNHAGSIDPNMLVILNDNDMSISENVGALTQYFSRILAGKTYCTLREGSKHVLSKVPQLSQLAKRTETHIKGMIQPGTLFEELGFNYFGPVDGHDLPSLIKILNNLKSLKGAKFLHIATVKGKGYAPAEQDPIAYHAVKPGFLDAQEKPKATKVTSYTDIFSQWVCDEAAQDERLVAITPAMREGSGLVAFSQQYKERYFDVGIAEQHCVTFAAGMACENAKPVVAIYSTFLQRAYDQLIHDVAIQKLDVTFAIDRAGLVGADGPTHAGSFDLSYMRCIPNLIVLAPADKNECRHMLHTAYHHKGPAAVRYPRGCGSEVVVQEEMMQYPIGKGEYRRQGKQIAILSFGSMLEPAMQAAETLNATVVNMRFIKPLDEQLIAELCESHDYLVTIEENTICGGAGSAVGEFIAQAHLKCQLLHLGLPDYFIEHGKPEDMLRAIQLDGPGIVEQVHAYIEACQSDVKGRILTDVMN